MPNSKHPIDSEIGRYVALLVTIFIALSGLAIGLNFLTGQAYPPQISEDYESEYVENITVESNTKHNIHLKKHKTVDEIYIFDKSGDLLDVKRIHPGQPQVTVDVTLLGYESGDTKTITYGLATDDDITLERGNFTVTTRQNIIPFV